MNDSRKQAQPSHHSGGKDQRAPVSGRSMVQIHAGLLETLLAAAGSEDELVTKLLRASVRGDRPRMVKLAGAIAEHRGVSEGNPGLSAEECHAPWRVVYEDKLLAAVLREESLLEELVAAVAREARPRLFSLCRALTENRMRFDPVFKRENHFPKDLTP